MTEKKISHAVYLKAVNHPIRRKMLEIVNENNHILRTNLIEKLIESGVINDDSSFDYNMNFLTQANCMIALDDDSEKKYEITQQGKVVEKYE